MNCTRPPGGRSFGVTFVHVFPLSRVTWNGPSLAPVQITPFSSGDSRDRVQRAVELFAGHVARDRLTAGPLTAIRRWP